MNEVKSLKEKLAEFFGYIENLQNPKPNDIINTFKIIFKEDYITKNISTDTAYYQENTNCYYIQNGCGIVLRMSSGDGDRFGNNVSHKGIDISISSLLAKESDLKYGISIFDESNFCKPQLVNNIDAFLEYDLSIENLKKNEDEFVYKTIPYTIKDNNEIICYRYNQLKQKAELYNEELYNDYMISPYGGLDIDVIPVDELLYGYIEKFNDEKNFKDRAMALFYCDFPEYFSEKIKECSYALYIIKHKNEYKTLLNFEESINQYEWNQSTDIDEINKQRSDKQLKLTKLLEEKRMLSIKKYNLFELVKGKKNFDKTRLSVITKSIENIKIELENLDKIVSEYNEELEDYKSLKDNYKTLQSKLKRPFKNFSINEDFMDMYIDGNYGNLVSLRKLVYLKGRYTGELKNLLENQSRAKENYEYVRENFLKLENNKNYEIEFQN